MSITTVLVPIVVILVIVGVLVFVASKARTRQQESKAASLREEAQQRQADLARHEADTQQTRAEAQRARAEAEALAAEARRKEAEAMDLDRAHGEKVEKLSEARTEHQETLHKADRIDPNVDHERAEPSGEPREDDLREPNGEIRTVSQPDDTNGYTAGRTGGHDEHDR